MNKYVKVVYESEPIGKEKIILYLTTFDVEKFEQDELKLAEKKETVVFSVEKSDLQQPGFLEAFEKNLNTYVMEYYDSKVKNLEGLINTQKAMKKAMPVSIYKSITNSDNVYCDIVQGNVTNCDNIYCNEIKGNVVNCDRIIYGKKVK